MLKQSYLFICCLMSSEIWLDDRCGGVRESIFVCLISVFCSSSTLNCLSSKTNFKVIMKIVFLTFVQNLLMRFITNTP